MTEKKEKASKQRGASEEPPKKRYIVSSKTGPKLPPRSDRSVRSFTAENEDADLVKSTPVGRHVVEMTEEQKKELEEQDPNLIVEEDRELDLYAPPGLPRAFVAETGEFSLAVTVRDLTTGRPVPDVTIFAVAEDQAFKAVTDAQGQAELLSPTPSLQKVVASPRDTYWSRVVRDVDLTGTQALDIALKPLLVAGAYSWGHRLMGFPAVNRVWTGKGIKVGVIDSGVSNTLPDIRPVGGHNTLEGADPNTWFIDEKGHGTHCTGIIAGLNNRIGVLGGAANAQVYSLKVFPGGFISDLVEAVEWCILNRMDVINMSLGSDAPSVALENVLKDAYNRGITCVAAAGNSSKSVSYPAAFPTTIAVSAIGRLGTFPEDSDHSRTITEVVDWQGQLFSASFTNFGPEIEVCAPGVAILSTVPTGYTAWDGTSFAAPLVSALAALILEAYPTIRTGDSRQPEFVRSIIGGSAANLGMPPALQGRGLPLAARALAAAQPLPTQPVWAAPQTHGSFPFFPPQGFAPSWP